MAAMNKELHNFLVEAELEHYYSALKNELKISALAHLKYVKDEDLMNVGMTKPEMRRLKKYYKKEVPHGTIGKIKKVRRIRWCGHVERKDKSSQRKAKEGMGGRSDKDGVERKMNEDLSRDRLVWKSIPKSCPTHASMLNGC